MEKYSFEFKLKLVQEYFRGEGGYKALGKKYGIDYSNIKRQCANYKEYGEDSLRRSRKNQKYTFEFKLHVVELYLTTETSYQELAFQFGITNSAQIARWVIDYRDSGIDALRPKHKGRKRNMDKEKIIKEIMNGDSEEQKELLKQLQDENLRLRIENAYLKELRRLRLEEEEVLLKKQRELSTVSEENSN